MINREFEKVYDEKLKLHEEAKANLYKYEQAHPAFKMGPIIQYPTTKESEEYSRLVELVDLSKKELEKVKKKYFGDSLDPDI